MKVRLIGIDLDGTSLQKDHETFSIRLRRDLQKAHEQGVKIIPVTGRPFSIRPEELRQQQSWMGIGVFANGAVIRDLFTEKVYYRSLIDGRHLAAVMDLADDPEIAVEAFVDGRFCVSRATLEKEKESSRLADHIKGFLLARGTVLEEEEWERLRGSRSEKIHVFCFSEEARKRLLSVPLLRELSLVEASPLFYEIMNKGVDKAAGLHKAAEICGIPDRETMAIGDSGNDLEMIREAGWGVAMGNAFDGLKKAADAVTDRYDEDGAAKAIEKWALSKS